MSWLFLFRAYTGHTEQCLQQRKEFFSAGFEKGKKKVGKIVRKSEKL
ncbi:hypothetical protein GTN66_06620 [bacterium]|nr:hypothetical protein [bacterium]NIO74068.1 hypothetical protein [bacterium]